MGSSRKYGPICTTSSDEPVDDGTLARTCSPAAGPVGGTLALEAAARRWRHDQEDAQRRIQQLFLMCMVRNETISPAQWRQAGQELGVEPELIQAFAAVENKGPESFEGRPAILFERHHFHKLTGGAYTGAHPQLSSATAGGYGKFRVQYEKLESALALDPTAALESTSWGMFQIMGENYHAAGFASVEQMVAAMAENGPAQLAAFVKFVQSKPALLAAMRKEPRDWAAIAESYNGAAYRKNSYDTKLKAAYDRIKAAAKPKHPPGPPKPPGPPQLPPQGEVRPNRLP